MNHHQIISNLWNACVAYIVPVDALFGKTHAKVIGPHLGKDPKPGDDLSATHGLRIQWINPPNKT